MEKGQYKKASQVLDRLSEKHAMQEVGPNILQQTICLIYCSVLNTVSALILLFFMYLLS